MLSLLQVAYLWSSHRDFHVRRSVIHQALMWLLSHNDYYQANHVHINLNCLAQLPEDGTLSHLTSISVECPENAGSASYMYVYLSYYYSFNSCVCT